MQSELEVPRRVLIVSYRRYLEADTEWVRASRAARAWFPVEDAPPRRAIGDPGSRLRRLYDRRERALQRLLLARQKLEQARLRLAPNRPAREKVAIRLLGYVAKT